MNWKKIILAGIFTIVLAATVSAATPTISIEELQPGMKGYAKTVIKGADIETFDVEILGVTGSDTGGHSILIKASGPVLERSGGIAQGMSGSPVYINGRLAGAVAYGREFSDPNYCFLTPIEEMLKLFDEPTPRPSVFLPKNTPLMVSGFTSDGLEYLKEKLAPLHLTAYAVPTGSGDFSQIQLEPGSSIGVELAKGDINVGSIGTVTYKDDDGRILAFGHPFLQRGSSDYFMTNAWIFASVPNMQSAFKVGALGNTLGSIKQDRSSGIAGKIGDMPKIIPMFVSATDKTRGEHKTSRVQLITDEDLVPALVDSICYNTVSKTSDRKGGGTSRISFDITARGDKQGEIHLRRENMFYHNSDIGKATDAELLYACNMLMKNRFEKVTIFDINVDVETTSNSEVAEIVSAKLLHRSVKQGGILPIEVTFKPYRSEKITRTFNFKVPDKQKVGLMNLVVRSGNSTDWLKSALMQQQAAGHSVVLEQKKLDFKDFLDDFNTADCNNTIVVDIMPSMPRRHKVADNASLEKDTMGLEAVNFRKVLKGSKDKQTYVLDFIATGEMNLVAEVEAR